VSLDAKPEYCALSYYWGAPGEEHIVKIKNKPFSLRRTLFAFLAGLQKHFGALKVWIDVICINQRDRKEQGQQVEMMQDIYRDAKAVYAWLGTADEDSERAFECLNSTDEEDLDDPASAWKYVRYVDQLFMRPYFNRAWIIQKCSLNSELTLFCGTRRAGWQTLQRIYPNAKKL
jgi:hypothetical protein